MDIYEWIIFFISVGFETFGYRLILLSKDKLKEKTIKEKNKKIAFFFGVFLFFIGFSIFFYLIILLFFPVIAPSRS